MPERRSPRHFRSAVSASGPAKQWRWHGPCGSRCRSVRPQGRSHPPLRRYGHRNTGNGQMAFNAASACTACGHATPLPRSRCSPASGLKVGKIHADAPSRPTSSQTSARPPAQGGECPLSPEQPAHRPRQCRRRRQGSCPRRTHSRRLRPGGWHPSQIQRAVGSLVAHHVQMALQDQARLLLVAGCGRCLMSRLPISS